MLTRVGVQGSGAVALKAQSSSREHSLARDELDAKKRNRSPRQQTIVLGHCTEGGGTAGAHPGGCLYRKLNPDVLVMESAEDRVIASHQLAEPGDVQVRPYQGTDEFGLRYSSSRRRAADGADAPRQRR